MRLQQTLVVGGLGDHQIIINTFDAMTRWYVSYIQICLWSFYSCTRGHKWKQKWLVEGEPNLDFWPLLLAFPPHKNSHSRWPFSLPSKPTWNQYKLCPVINTMPVFKIITRQAWPPWRLERPRREVSCSSYNSSYISYLELGNNKYIYADTKNFIDSLFKFMACSFVIQFLLIYFISRVRVVDGPNNFIPGIGTIQCHQSRVGQTLSTVKNARDGEKKLWIESKN